MKNRRIPALLAVCCLLFAAPSFSAEPSTGMGVHRRIPKSPPPSSARAPKPAAASYGTPLTSTGIEKWDCDLAPNASLIVFEDENSIYTMPASGGDPVDFLPEETGYCFNPRFTPDSAGITYSRIDYDTDMATFRFERLDHSFGTLIAQDAVNGCLSPDGKFAAYRSYSTGELILLNRDTKQTTILAAGDWGYAPSCFTPEGGAIITSLDPGDGSLRLFRLPLNGDKPEQLTFHDGDHFSPDISADGHWLLYNTEYTYSSTEGAETYYDTLFALDLTNLEATDLFPDGDRWNGYGRFFPNGGRFAYLLDTGGTNEVHVTMFPLADAAKSLTLKAPNGGEIWPSGTQREITWQSMAVETVRLEYSISTAASWKIIASGIDASTGSYMWNVPNNPSPTCRVRITDESDADISSTSAGDFTIQSSVQVASITVIAPNGGETINAGTIRPVTWSSTAVAAVRLEYTLDGTAWHLIESSVAAGDGTFDWLVPATVNSTTCRVRVSAMVNASVTDQSDSPFTITSAMKPTIDVLAPEAGEEWEAGSTRHIAWTSTGVSVFAIAYSTDDGAMWMPIIDSYTPADVVTAAQKTYSYQWTVPDTPSSVCRIRVTSAKDADVASISANTFVIASTLNEPPLVMKYQTSGSIGFSSPALDANGTVYAASGDNFLYALLPDGTQKWRADLGGSVWSSPAIASDGTIYIGTSSNILFALTANGAIRWKYTVGGSIIATPAIAGDGTIYIGSDDGWLYAVKTDGSLRWRVELGESIYSSAAIGLDGTIYVAGTEGTVHAIGANGVRKWNYPTSKSVFSSPAIASDGTIFIGSGGYLVALNPNGTFKWRSLLGTAVESSPAIGPDGTIYIGVEGPGDLCAIDPSNGSVIWRYTTGGSIIGSPLVGADGAVYIGSEDWKLYCFNPTGFIRWTYTTFDTIWSSPTINNDGIVYFGSDDGAIYGVDSDTGTGLSDSPWPKFHRDVMNGGRVRAQSMAFVLVVAPDGGETFAPDSTIDITWTANDVSTVNIDFSSDAGQSWSPVAQGIQAALGSHAWLIPGDVTSNQCFIRVSDAANPAIKDRSNNTFSISAQPFIAVTTPKGGEKWKAGTKETIVWESYGIDHFTLQFSPDGGSTWSPITSGLAAVSGLTAQSYSWIVPQSLSTDCIIRITNSDDADVRDDSPVFSIVSSSFVTVTSPTLGDRWTTGSVKDITWEFNGVSAVLIELSTDNGTTWSVINEAAPTESGTYGWTVPDSPAGQCLIRLTSTADASITDVSDQFSIIQPELTITHTPLASARENEAVTFTAAVTGTAAIESVNLHFDETGSRDFLEPAHIMTMTTTGGDQYAYLMQEGIFTAQGIEYYIIARDENGNTARSPADEGYYSIVAQVSDVRTSHPTPGGSEQNAYRMVSIPLNLTQSSITAQLAGDLPTGEQGVDWRLFRYSPGEEAPAEYPNIEGFGPGLGFWLITREPFTFTAPAGSTVSTAESFSITLKSGWNDIANPWMFEIMWDDIENPSGANISTPYGYEGSWANPLTFDGVLHPWQGYAVNNLETHNVIIKLVPRTIQKTARPAAMAPPQWSLQLRAEAGDALDCGTVLGVRDASSTGYDRADHVEPPGIGQYVQVTFPHQDWTDHPSDYTVDMRPPGLNSWDFDVRTLVPDENVTLTVEGSESLPEGTGYRIVDAITGEPAAITDGALTFRSGPDGAVRHFTIEVGTGLSQPDAGTPRPQDVLNAVCFPNPFNPRTTIRYELSRQASVTVTIYNTVGQAVRVFDLGPMDTGTHDLIFEPDDLTSGMYFYRVDAGWNFTTGKMLYMK